MGWLSLEWIALGASTFVGGVSLLYVFHRGVRLQNDSCGHCKYILVSPITTRCPECGVELSPSTIRHKGDISILTRVLFLLSWTLLLILPTRLIFLYIEPSPPTPNYTSMFTYQTETQGDSIVNPNSDSVRKSNKQLFSNVKKFIIGVPSQVTHEVFKETYALDITKLDCMITIFHDDGTTSKMLILPGATQFIVNPGSDAETMFNRPPSILDYAELAGLTAELSTDSSVGTNLGYLLENTLAMMKIPSPLGVQRSIHLFHNNCYHQPYSGQVPEGSEKRQLYYTLTSIGMFTIWIVGTCNIIGWGNLSKRTLSSPRRESFERKSMLQGQNTSRFLK